MRRRRDVRRVGVKEAESAVDISVIDSAVDMLRGVRFGILVFRGRGRGVLL